MKTLSLLLALLPAAAGAAEKLKPVDLGPAQWGPDFGAVEILNGNCLACHSAEMVTHQPSPAKTAWQATVTKMIKVYKAPINEADVPAIIEALDRLGAPSR